MCVSYASCGPFSESVGEMSTPGEPFESGCLCAEGEWQLCRVFLRCLFVPEPALEMAPNFGGHVRYTLYYWSDL